MPRKSARANLASKNEASPSPSTNLNAGERTTLLRNLWLGTQVANNPEYPPDIRDKGRRVAEGAELALGMQDHQARQGRQPLQSQQEQDQEQAEQLKAQPGR